MKRRTLIPSQVQQSGMDLELIGLLALFFLVMLGSF